MADFFTRLASRTIDSASPARPGNISNVVASADPVSPTEFDDGSDAPPESERDRENTPTRTLPADVPVSVPAVSAAAAIPPTTLSPEPGAAPEPRIPDIEIPHLRAEPMEMRGAELPAREPMNAEAARATEPRRPGTSLLPGTLPDARPETPAHAPQHAESVPATITPAHDISEAVQPEAHGANPAESQAPSAFEGSVPSQAHPLASEPAGIQTTLTRDSGNSSPVFPDRSDAPASTPALRGQGTQPDGSALPPAAPVRPAAASLHDVGELPGNDDEDSGTARRTAPHLTSVRRGDAFSVQPDLPTPPPQQARSFLRRLFSSNRAGRVNDAARDEFAKSNRGPEDTWPDDRAVRDRAQRDTPRSKPVWQGELHAAVPGEAEHSETLPTSGSEPMGTMRPADSSVEIPEAMSGAQPAGAIEERETNNAFPAKARPGVRNPAPAAPSVEGVIRQQHASPESRRDGTSTSARPRSATAADTPAAERDAANHADIPEQHRATPREPMPVREQSPLREQSLAREPLPSREQSPSRIEPNVRSAVPETHARAESRSANTPDVATHRDRSQREELRNSNAAGVQSRTEAAGARATEMRRAEDRITREIVKPMQAAAERGEQHRAAEAEAGERPARRSSAMRPANEATAFETRGDVKPMSSHVSEGQASQAAAAQSRREAAQSPPSINISIGKVEVRAEAPPSAPPPRASSRPRGPALSLSDYLKQRNRGHQ